MRFLKQYKIAVILGAILILFLLLRFYNILQLSIFTDEAIYLRWAQIAKNDANWRFISLTDGKQPSFIWLTMMAMRFIEDPLLAGRIVSIVAGFFSTIGLFFLTRELFKNTTMGIIASFLYVIYPMALVYDRMALYDSLVGMFSIWCLFLTVLLVRKLRLDVALLLGIAAGGAVLTKTNGFFTMYLLPFSLLLFNWQKKDRYLRLAKWIGLFFVVVILANFFYSILRLSPFFHIIEEKNGIFVYPITKWLSSPSDAMKYDPVFDFWSQHLIEVFLNNWKAQWDWLMKYITLPIMLLVPLSFIIKKTYTKEKLVAFLWFFVPFAFLAFFGNTIYPRFIFFMTLALIPLISFSLYALFAYLAKKSNKGIYAFVVVFLLLFAMQFRAGFLVLTNFAAAPIAVSDLGQYHTGWPSGIGIKESVVFFKQQAEKQKIFIATQGTFGLLPFAYELYFVDHPNITLKGFWPIENEMPQEVIEASKQMPTYFVFYQPCVNCPNKGIAPTAWKEVQLIQQVSKKQDNTFFSIYQVQSK